MSVDTDGIRITVIYGSARPGNYTAKAAALVLDELHKQPDVIVDSVDPVGIDLTLPGVGPVSQAVQEMREKVTAATGVLFAIPEYHGSFSSVTKLIIDNLGFPSGIRGKPVALLGVASGAIGAIKALEHLRSVCSHMGSIVLPGPVSVARVREVFDVAGNCLDPKVEERIRALPRHLIDYIRERACPLEFLEKVVREGETAL
jgi:chromate reductase